MTTAPDPLITAYWQRLLDDFEFFVEEIWKNRGLDRVAPLGWLERDMLAFASGSGSAQFRCILAPRGTGKTTLNVATLTLWRLFRDAERKVIIVSKSETEARKTISLIREWINHVPFLQHLRPGRDQRDSATKFDVTGCKPSRQPSVTAIGIDGQLEGNRADSIFPDDVETASNTITLDAREALANRVSEFKAILYPARPASEGGRIDPPEIVFDGTYHHEESLYLKLSPRGYNVRTYTLVGPGPDEKQLNLAPVIADALASGKLLPGAPTMPHRFNAEEIRSRQAEGRRHFLMQYQLVADLGDTLRYPLRLSDLIVIDHIDPDIAPVKVVWGTSNHNGSTEVTGLPNLGFSGDRLYGPVYVSDRQDWMPFTGTKAVIDPAGRGPDHVGLAIISHLAGMLWVKVCKGVKGGYDPATLGHISATLRDHRVNEVWIEDNMARGLFQEVFAPIVRKFYLKPGENPAHPAGWSCSIDSFNAVGQKELRVIDAIEPVLSNHRLVFARSAIEPARGQDSGGTENQIQYQLTRITRQRGALKEDGAIDALASCIQQWQHTLRTSPEHGQARAHEARIDAYIREVERSGGIHRPQHSWLTPRR